MTEEGTETKGHRREHIGNQQGKQNEVAIKKEYLEEAK